MNIPAWLPGGMAACSAGGESLHAPLVERLLELPMDIHAGRLDGELRLRCVDTASWQFPEFYGNVRVRGA